MSVTVIENFPESTLVKKKNFYYGKTNKENAGKMLSIHRNQRNNKGTPHAHLFFYWTSFRTFDDYTFVIRNVSVKGTNHSFFQTPASTIIFLTNSSNFFFMRPVTLLQFPSSTIAKVGLKGLLTLFENYSKCRI